MTYFTKRLFTFITAIILFIYNEQFISGQLPSRDVFNFIFEANFNNDQLGDYLLTELNRDWNYPQSTERISEVDILSDNDSRGNYMRGYFPVGVVGAEKSGWTWNTALKGSNTELYYSYDLRFKPGFIWVLGGKIPGITGGHVYAGTEPAYDDGFSIRGMWAPEGGLIFYIYHQDRKTVYGDTYVWNNFNFVAGQWYNITFRIVLNTIQDNVGDHNGILEGFIDGKLIIQLKNFNFRNYESITIDNLSNCSFFGGAESDFNPQRDEWLDVDNFVVYTYASDVLDVPRGQQTSSFSKTLLHPYHTFSDTDWKKSLSYNSVTSTSVNLSWMDYPVPSTYILERKIDGSTTFSTIASLDYGTKIYSDKNLQPDTKYNYRIQAGTSTSNLISVTTSPAVIPNSPSALTATAKTKSTITLRWTDNSTNELGFKIYRSLSATVGFSQIASIAANVITYTDNALQPSTKYYYKIIAYNANGNSAFTPVLSVTTAALQPPVAPSSFSSPEQSKNSITLTWTDNSNNEQGFFIYRSSSPSSSFEKIATLSSNITSYTDGQLQPSTTYYYQLCAYNEDGNSSFSPVIKVKTTEIEPPVVPSLLSATGQNKNTIILKWTDNSDNEQGFIVYRSFSPSGVFIEVDTLPANITTYTNKFLQPSTTYYYMLKSYNQGGMSSYTKIVSATTADLQPPEAPTGLIASHIEYMAATVLWTDNATNETEFELERSGPDDELITNIIALPENAVSYTDTGLVMNSTYQYRIRAMNDDGVSDWSNRIEVITPRLFPPVAPTKLKSTKFTDKSISVSWNDNSSNEDAFVITRSLAAQPETAVTIIVSANDTAYTDSCLTSSTTYQYTIKAVNLGGSSSLSNKNVATTLSKAELKRVKDGLVAYYNFGYNPDYIIYDQSGYQDPVNLNILNRYAINWNEDNTIDLLSNTAMVSITPATKIIQALKSTNEITFECWIKPKDPDFSTKARIVSLGNNDEEVGFLIDQVLLGDPQNLSLAYSARIQTESTNPSGNPEYFLNHAQPFINLIHLSYVKDNMGMEAMYLNGEKSSEGFRPSDLTWKDDFYLRLGNESDMNHSWRGSYYSVAIYNKALSQSEIMNNYTAGPCDSIQNNDISYLVKVFPNPIHDQATLTLTPEQVADFVPQTSIRIINMFGTVLHQEYVFNPNSHYIKMLNFDHYPQGIYYLQVISGKSQKTTKLVVQH